MALFTKEDAKTAAMYLKDYSYGVMPDKVLYRYLPDGFVEWVYHKHAFENRVEDAEAAFEDYAREFEYDKGDCEVLAERFIENHDCNIDENSQWAYLVSEYVCEVSVEA